MDDPASIDAFVASITTSIRRSLYQRLKTLPLSDTEMTTLLATATRAAIDRSYVADLAAIAVAGGPLAAALADTVPEGDPQSPEVVAWRQRRDRAPLLVREMLML